MRFYAGPRLLIVDEVGYLPLPGEAAAALFQVVSQRYLKGSIVLTTNLGIASWGKVFNDDADGRRGHARPPPAQVGRRQHRRGLATGCAAIGPGPRPPARRSPAHDPHRRVPDLRNTTPRQPGQLRPLVLLGRLLQVRQRHRPTRTPVVSRCRHDDLPGLPAFLHRLGPPPSSAPTPARRPPTGDDETPATGAQPFPRPSHDGQSPSTNATAAATGPSASSTAQPATRGCAASGSAGHVPNATSPSPSTNCSVRRSPLDSRVSSHQAHSIPLTNCGISVIDTAGFQKSAAPRWSPPLSVAAHATPSAEPAAKSGPRSRLMSSCSSLLDGCF